MRIGILTFWMTKENYGQILQTYASQKFLRKEGYDAYTIRYLNTGEKHQSVRPTFFDQIKKLVSINHWKYIYKYVLRRKIYIKLVNRFYLNHNVDRGFSTFTKEHIVSTEKIYSQKDMIQSPPIADCYMVGSDIVWGQDDPIYFLQFGAESKVRVALAASFGNTIDGIAQERRKRISDYLNHFELLTLREEEGVQICKELGAENPILLCDPTMLLEVSDYEKLAVHAEIPDVSKSIFMYFIHSDPSLISVHKIASYLNKTKQKFNYAGAQWAVNTIPKVFPTIEQWIAYIRDSKFIITNSFHGVVFSLLFQKQFAVIPLELEGRNTRIKTILGSVGLSNRICNTTQDIENCFNQPIDYKLISSKVHKIQNDGRTIITNFLKECTSL